MTETKSLFLSKTFWGSVIAVGGAIAGLFGLDLTNADQVELTGLVDQALGVWDTLVVIAGGLLAIYGRITATKTIG